MSHSSSCLAITVRYLAKAAYEQDEEIHISLGWLRSKAHSPHLSRGSDGSRHVLKLGRHVIVTIILGHRTTSLCLRRLPLLKSLEEQGQGGSISVAHQADSALRPGNENMTRTGHEPFP